MACSTSAASIARAPGRVGVEVGFAQQVRELAHGHREAPGVAGGARSVLDQPRHGGAVERAQLLARAMVAITRA